MSKDYPTLEENIQFIIKNLGVEKIAQAIPAEQEEALLRALLLKRFSPGKVESILRDDGKRKT